jgi:hypothetical protein
MSDAFRLYRKKITETVIKKITPLIYNPSEGEMKGMLNITRYILDIPVEAATSKEEKEILKLQAIEDIETVRISLITKQLVKED